MVRTKTDTAASARARATAICTKLVFLCFCLWSFSAVVFAAAQDYVVQKGETLYSISRSFSVSVDDICRENGIQKNGTLKAGQKLKIPQLETKSQSALPSLKPQTYSVTRDDTLFSIARKFSMSVDELKKINNLTTDTIKVGQPLKVYESAEESPHQFSILLENAFTDPRNYAGKQGDTSLVWPVKASSVTYVAGKISGVQLGAKKDENVSSISRGTVMFSGLYRGFGQVVFVQNSLGYVYVYTGLANVAVQKGDAVTLGSVLGKTGVDSLNGKSGLTFMVYKNGKPMDPASAPRG
jgi:LysM repeat protein